VPLEDRQGDDGRSSTDHEPVNRYTTESVTNGQSGLRLVYLSDRRKHRIANYTALVLCYSETVRSQTRNLLIVDPTYRPLYTTPHTLLIQHYSEIFVLNN